MIQLKNVTFKYSEEEQEVLKDLTIEIPQGEWVALIGHNGSGKSTVAKLINGLLLPTNGTISINGLELTEETIWDVRKEVGMVFQNPENQFVGTTVIDDVAFGLENHGVEREEMKRRIDDSLKLVGMSDYKLHEPHRLSGGQKQRVAIASVLAIMPNILIFDEATTMLDPVGRMQLIDTIKTVRKERGLTVISITHDLNEAIYADRVIVLNKGSKWFEGNLKELYKKYDQLEQVSLLPPFVQQLAHKLKENDITIEEPLHYKELVDQLWKLYSNK